jgi:hypothetical protein
VSWALQTWTFYCIGKLFHHSHVFLAVHLTCFASKQTLYLLKIFTDTQLRSFWKNGNFSTCSILQVLHNFIWGACNGHNHLHLNTLNNFIIPASCNSKVSQKQFGLTLVQGLILKEGRGPWPHAHKTRKTSPISQLKRPDTSVQEGRKFGAPHVPLKTKK